MNRWQKFTELYSQNIYAKVESFYSLDSRLHHRKYLSLIFHIPKYLAKR